MSTGPGLERRAHGRRAIDHPSVIHLTPHQLWAVFVLIWFTSVVASAGVGWFFAGKSAEETTAVLRAQSQAQAQSLYTSVFNRCTTASEFRRATIHNAELQAGHDPGTIILRESTSCAEQVPAPVGVASNGTTVVESPLKRTLVG